MNQIELITFATSVFPTPVGPLNKKLPIGFYQVQAQLYFFY